MKCRLLLVLLTLVSSLAWAETVFLIGDSTVSNFSPPDPRNGWGQVFDRHFTPDVKVKNFAISGRSSKSFFNEGAWAPVVAAILPGDYVFIQFGHNDEKRDERGTTPFGTYQEQLSRYVDETLKAGGTPILVTPVARGRMKPSTGENSHGDYPDAVIALARKKGVLLVDLNALSNAYYDKIGYNARLKLFIASIDGKDDTHFTPVGALEIARLVAQAVKELPTPLAQKVIGLTQGPTSP